jgi:hypothetical protein
LKSADAVLVNTTIDEMYRAFAAYCGGRCESKIAFGKRLKNRDFDQAKIQGGVRVWKGISLLGSTLGESSGN